MQVPELDVGAERDELAADALVSVNGALGRLGDGPLLARARLLRSDGAPLRFATPQEALAGVRRTSRERGGSSPRAGLVEAAARAPARADRFPLPEATRLLLTEKLDGLDTMALIVLKTAALLGHACTHTFLVECQPCSQARDAAAVEAAVARLVELGLLRVLPDASPALGDAPVLFALAHGPAMSRTIARRLLANDRRLLQDRIYADKAEARRHEAREAELTRASAAHNAGDVARYGALLVLDAAAKTWVYGNWLQLKRNRMRLAAAWVLSWAPRGSSGFL